MFVCLLRSQMAYIHPMYIITQSGTQGDINQKNGKAARQDDPVHKAPFRESIALSTPTYVDHEAVIAAIVEVLGWNISNGVFFRLEILFQK